MSGKTVAAAILMAGLLVGFGTLVGCIHQSLIPPGGVLSSQHQRLLTEATDRAFQEAMGLFNSDRGKSYQLVFAGDTNREDVGRSFVKQLIQRKFTDSGITLANSEKGADKQGTAVFTQTYLLGVVGPIESFK